jgi:pimeloyl-ACP methyl ester carboxylesterase
MDGQTDTRSTPGHSRTVDIDGPVHHVDFGGREDGPIVVLVHGLGGSHLNWDLFAPLLTPHARVHALDLPGFGRSEPGERTANVRDNVVVLDRFVREVTGGPVVLVGNSMGGMVSVLEAQRSPAKVSGLVLVDPALPGPRGRPDPRVAAAFGLYALPGAGRRYLAGRRRRLGARGTVREMLELCGVDPDAVPPSLIDRSVALVDDRRDVAGMDRAFLTAARSLLLLLADPRLMRRAMAGLQVPVLLVHGDRDRLVPVSVARDVARRHPDWRYVELPGVGHVPQLQCPELLAEHLLAWLPTVSRVR